MEHTTGKSNLFFGIFFLREQLHTFIDVFEENQYRITQHLNCDISRQLFHTKRLMLGMAERQYMSMRFSPIDDAALFHPFKRAWMEDFDIKVRRYDQNIKQYLLIFDKKLMAWCYLFMTNENTNADLAGFFLQMIQWSKESADILMAVKKNSS